MMLWFRAASATGLIVGVRPTWKVFGLFLVPRLTAPPLRFSEEPEEFGMSIHHVAGMFLKGLPAVACRAVLVLLVSGFGNCGFTGFHPGRFYV